MHVPVFLSVSLLPLLMHLVYQIFLILRGENISQNHLVFYMKFCISCYHHFFSTIIKRSREKAGKNGGYLWVL